MICAIHQPQFLPWLGYLQKLNTADVFVLLDNVQFRKNEFQNRNRICSDGRSQWLTVPVSFHFGDLIRDVRVVRDQVWRTKMIRTVEYCYRHAEYFEKHAGHFASLVQRDWNSLAEVNAATVAWLKDCFQLDAHIVWASSLSQISNERTQRLVDICKAVGADTYLSGSLAKCYLCVDQFEKAGIQVRFQAFRHPTYEQRNNRAGFLSHMSALDALFNCGGGQTARALLNLDAQP